MTSETIVTLLGRIYTSFILRDGTFVLSGGVVIVAIKPVLIERFTDALLNEVGMIWLLIAAFLALSYVVGVLLQETVLLVFDAVRDRGWPKPGSVVPDMEIVRRTCSAHTVNGVERILFLKQIGATMFATLATLAVLALVGSIRHIPDYFWPTVVFGLIVTALTFFRKAQQQEWVLYELADLEPRS